jgi:uncharacterized membrane protein YbhN (UPF0104 family)
VRWTKSVIKWLITCLVVAFVAWEFARQWSQLPAEAWRLDTFWLAVCGAVYLVAYLPSLFYWRWCLRSLGQPTPFAAVFRAYFVGHVGKYVPGKALVPILRAALLHAVQVQPAATILAVFYETLTCMAAGAFLVAGFLLFQPQAQQLAPQLVQIFGNSSLISDWPTWLAAGAFILLGLAMLSPLVPAGFNRLARWLVLRNHTSAPITWGLSYNALLTGLVVGIVNWWLLGLSAWLALKAMIPANFSAELLGQVTLSISAAVVLGFVSLLPGGFGVREGILAWILAGVGVTTAPQAALMAVVLRLVWIVSEVLAAVALMAPDWWRTCLLCLPRNNPARRD